MKENSGSASATLPTYAADGGGPWIKDLMPVDWAPLEASLRAIPEEVGVSPTAILAVSAHRQERQFTVQTSPNPPMLYDYGGFPDFTYQIEYPAPGSPEVARRIVELLDRAGLAVATDDRRGFDHGMFAPLYVSYPDADVPMLQLSLKLGLDPRAHLDLGRAFRPLRDEGILIIGSGLPSYHDLRTFDPPASNPHASSTPGSRRHWSTMSATTATTCWSVGNPAPSARKAHPREEHLLPVMVAVGAAEGEAGVRQYHEERFMGSLASSGYRFGAIDN